MSFEVSAECQHANIGGEVRNQPASTFKANLGSKLTLEIKLFFISEPQECAVIITTCCCLSDRQAQGLSLWGSWLCPGGYK